MYIYIYIYKPLAGSFIALSRSAACSVRRTSYNIIYIYMYMYIYIYI